MGKREKRPNYTAEFKADAISLVLEHGYTCKEASRRLGISKSNVSRWVQLHRKETQEVDETGTTMRELQAEVRRLRWTQSFGQPTRKIDGKQPFLETACKALEKLSILENLTRNVNYSKFKYLTRYYTIQLIEKNNA